MRENKMLPYRYIYIKKLVEKGVFYTYSVTVEFSVFGIGKVVDVKKTLTYEIDSTVWFPEDKSRLIEYDPVYRLESNN